MQAIMVLKLDMNIDQHRDLYLLTLSRFADWNHWLLNQSMYEMTHSA